MPDLTSEGVHQFWKDYRDPIIYRVVSFMESVENWTLDGDEALETTIHQLGETLDDLGAIDLAEEDKFIKLCVFLRTGRALRLLQSMDTANPGAAAKLLMHAEETSESSEDLHGLFLRRNVVFERLRLLARVLSPQRFALILKALEDEHD